MKHRLACSIVLSLALATSARAAEVNLSGNGDDLAARLKAQGWHEVSKGVLERRSDGKAVETLAFGPVGMKRALADARSRHAALLQDYRTRPSADLARALSHLKSQIAELAKISRAPGAASAMPSVMSGCNVWFGADAQAYPLGYTQGVGASGSAYFYNDCGASGSVYAYASGSTNVFSDTHTNYPPAGSNVAASAAISVGGGPACASVGYGSVTSSSFGGISYAAYQSNNTCPAPPLSASISGPSILTIFGYDCDSATWYANVSGGTPPYYYSWTVNGGGAGNGSSASETFCGSNTGGSESVGVSLTVTDSSSPAQSTNVSFTTTVRYRRENPCLGGNLICQIP
jgi:hypothetical protein